jgi:predicted bacteriocin transport accessory protein
MKKILCLLIIGIFLLTGCSNNLKTIKYDEFEKMINNKETFILEISQNGCSHCNEYNPIIKKVLKDNNITAYNLNISYISNKEYDKLKEEYNFSGTPTTMFFNKGEEIFSSRIVGSTSETKLTKTLKRLKYVK